MTTFSAERVNMIESQIRPNAVTDRRLLQALYAVPREAFVPGPLRALAYMDEHLQVAAPDGKSGGRYLLAPMPFARLLQFARVKEGDAVLDIGCATGYSTAVLAKLAASVVGLESDAALAANASKALEDIPAGNAAIVTGPLEEGCAAKGPYNVIMFNGGVPAIPDAIFAQLADGGRLVAVITQAQSGKAYLFQKLGSQVSGRPVFDAGAPRLPGFTGKHDFVF